MGLYAAVCSHCVATAEREGLLKEVVQQVNPKRKKLKNSSCSSMDLLGVGRQGQKQRRMRQFHSSNKTTSAINQSPFSEIWHNSKPLEILYVRDKPENKCFCTCCGTKFLRGPVSVLPFDLSASRFHTKNDGNI